MRWTIWIGLLLVIVLAVWWGMRCVVQAEFLGVPLC